MRLELSTWAAQEFKSPPDPRTLRKWYRMGELLQFGITDLRQIPACPGGRWYVEKKELDLSDWADRELGYAPQP